MPSLASSSPFFFFFFIIFVLLMGLFAYLVFSSISGQKEQKIEFVILQ
jgi:hypothetical protein